MEFQKKLSNKTNINKILLRFWKELSWTPTAGNLMGDVIPQGVKLTSISERSKDVIKKQGIVEASELLELPKTVMWKSAHDRPRMIGITRVCGHVCKSCVRGFLGSGLFLVTLSGA